MKRKMLCHNERKSNMTDKFSKQAKPYESDSDNETTHGPRKKKKGTWAAGRDATLYGEPHTSETRKFLEKVGTYYPEIYA